jgi:transcriptional accessory protein Tex/SPT6
LGWNFGASEILDATGVHPESYGVARKLNEILAKFGVKTGDQFSAIFPKISAAFSFHDASLVQEISREIFYEDPRKVMPETYIINLPE